MIQFRNVWRITDLNPNAENRNSSLFLKHKLGYFFLSSFFLFQETQPILWSIFHILVIMKFGTKIVLFGKYVINCKKKVFIVYIMCFTQLRKTAFFMGGGYHDFLPTLYVVFSVCELVIPDISPNCKIPFSGFKALQIGKILLSRQI